MTNQPLVLNEGQQEAADNVFHFLFDTEKEFSITGPAGTGKTTLMAYIMKTVIKEYKDAAALMGAKGVDYEFHLTATTNKAADVLSQSTGLPVSTIHSFLGLRVQDNYKTGEQTLMRTKNFKVYSNIILFVDEASMVDSVLYGHLMDALDDTCKVIYLGDHCQMTPVNEDLSPVYRNPKYSAPLIQPMRNADQPALMALCSQLRQTVETGIFKPIREVPGVIEYLDEDTAHDFMEQTFLHEDPGCRALAFSNIRVQEYLSYIREIRGYQSFFQDHERVVNNSSFDIGGDKILPPESLHIITGTDHTIYTDTFKSNGDEFDIQHYRVRLKGIEQMWFNVPVDFQEVRRIKSIMARRKDWGPMFDVRDSFIDLRGSDAATVYKAQGSSYDTVLLDLNDINRAHTLDQAARLLYVGASRARQKLYLWGELSGRFFL